MTAKLRLTAAHFYHLLPTSTRIFELIFDAMLNALHADKKRGISV
jgi:hypothetical protein